MLIKSTLVLILTSVAFARDAVLSRGVFVGVDTTEKNASPIEVFRNPMNHATAAASVIRRQAERTFFLPHKMGPAELCGSFDRWKDTVIQFPGFKMTRRPRPEDVVMEGEAGKLGKALQRGLTALSVPHATDVAFEFIDLIPEKLEDRSLKEFVLSVMVIEKPKNSQEVMVRLVELLIELESSMFSKKVSIPDQTIRLKLVEMKVDKDFMQRNAQTLAKAMPKTLVSEFMWMLTSPKKEDLDLECLNQDRFSQWIDGF
ncbi:hypothetical protein DFQ27_000008 [Actinomortierella ambigua]|uniref:Uncharacterized protein n=1 Tax=Actinomortierella ambigua TaxID=1343610 RepID=A0A9P6QJJ5_9FUNG|nr:hypothetical protein DFQ27_000008 [Actinomortierella ambigua]